MNHFNVNQVAVRYGVSEQTIWSWMRQGRFPQPLRISRKCSRWTEGMLEEFDGNRDAWQPKKERKRSYGGRRLRDCDYEDDEGEELRFCPLKIDMVYPIGMDCFSCAECKGPLQGGDWIEVCIDECGEEIQWELIPDWRNYEDLEYSLALLCDRYGISHREKYFPFGYRACSESCAAARTAKSGGLVAHGRRVGVLAGLPSRRTLEKYPEDWRAPLVASRLLDFRARYEAKVDKDGQARIKVNQQE